jgi:hypothetical protein
MNWSPSVHHLVIGHWFPARFSRPSSSPLKDKTCPLTPDAAIFAVVHLEAHIEKRALPILQAHPLGAGASVVGIVKTGQAGLVTMTTAIGGTRVVDMLSGEQLPRIC